jgi:hypothetical protein
MQEENIKSKQVRPKQFRGEKRIWKIHVHQIEKTLERKEGKPREDKARQKKEKQTITVWFTLLFLLSTQGNNRLCLMPLTSP